MADFRPMGNIPEGYDSLLNAARQQLVRLPDGSYVQAPQFGQGTNLNELYAGILPPPAPNSPLISRKVNTVPIDPMTGNPIFVGSSSGPGFQAPNMAATRSEQTGMRQAMTQGVQPAGTAQMPPGARPQSVDQAFAQMGGGVWDPFGTSSRPKDETRLPPNDGGESGFMSAFFPGQDSPAVGAINQAAPPVPMPRPLPPAQIPAMTGAAPSVPMPRSRPTPPSPKLGSITFKRGDTVSQLAQDRGMTSAAFADLYGIANPNKIRAGATVTPQVPIPRVPSSAQRTPPQSRDASRGWSNLDPFGNII